MDLRFSAEELTVLEELQVFGGDTPPTPTQTNCTNNATGCGYGTSQGTCTNGATYCTCGPVIEH